MAIGTGVPVKIYEIVTPILLDVLEDLIQQSSTALSDAIRKRIESNIPNTSPCNDLELRALVERLKQLQDQLNNFDSLLNKLIGISGILSAIGLTAKAISVYLTISGTPVAPAPLVKALNIISLLATNAVSVSKLLVNLLEQISVQLDVIITNLNRAIDVTNALCPSNQLAKVPTRNISVNEIDKGFVDNAVLGTVTTTGNFGTGQPTDSIFYRDVNVSDPDLNKRLDIVQDLVARQLDTITGIKEAPSKVVSGNQNPTAADGNVGDYFINIATGEIFGPKTLQGTWI